MNTRPDRGVPAADRRPPAMAPSGERPWTLRAAALASGVESVAMLLYAVLLAAEFVRSDQHVSVPGAVGLVAVFVLLGAALAVCAVGLWRARRRGRAFAAVIHALIVLISLSVVRASPLLGSTFLLVGAGGLGALFARPTGRALGRARLPGS